MRLVIDLSLQKELNLMSVSQIRTLSEQLVIVNAKNKRALNPFHLYFTSLTGPVKVRFLFSRDLVKV